MKLLYLSLAVVLSGCIVPTTVAIPLFTTAAIAGAGAAVGAGAVDLSWAHLPMIGTPSAVPTPLAEHQ